MSYKMKEILSSIGEIVGFLLMLYVGYYIYVVACVSDGAGTGELYYWLGMHHVTAAIKSFLTWCCH